MLTNRQELILFLIVDEFLAAMIHVSSKQIIQKYQLDISSATVRNEIVILEASGFLTKPHTSAGRMPSREALKFYIKKLSEKLDEEIKPETVHLNLQNHHTPEELSGSIAEKISTRTNYLTGVSFLGKDEIVKAIYFTPLSEVMLLVIIVLDSGNIKKIPVKMGYDVSLETLELLTNYFNQIVVDIGFIMLCIGVITALLPCRFQLTKVPLSCQCSFSMKRRVTEIIKLPESCNDKASLLISLL